MSSEKKPDSLRPASREPRLSVVHRTGLEHEYNHQVELSKHNLSWSVRAPWDPLLLVSLRSIGGAKLETMETVLCVNTKNKSIQFVEKEMVIKAIPFSKILGVQPSTTDPTVFAVYLEGKPPFEICTYNTEDARNVAYVMKRATAADFSGFKFGLLVIHEGFADKRGGNTAHWAFRYLRLIKGQLLCYRAKNSRLPVDVIPLTDALIGNSLSKDTCFDVSTLSMSFTFRLKTSAERKQWLHALHEEKKINQTLNTLCGEKTRALSVRDVIASDITDVLEQEHGARSSQKKNSVDWKTMLPMQRTASASVDMNPASVFSSGPAGGRHQMAHGRYHSTSSADPASPKCQTKGGGCDVSSPSRSTRSALDNSTDEERIALEIALARGRRHTLGVPSGESAFLRHMSLAGVDMPASWQQIPSTEKTILQVRFDGSLRSIGFIAVDPTLTLRQARSEMEKSLNGLPPTYVFLVKGVMASPHDEGVVRISQVGPHIDIRPLPSESHYIALSRSLRRPSMQAMSLTEFLAADHHSAGSGKSASSMYLNTQDRDAMFSRRRSSVNNVINQLSPRGRGLSTSSAVSNGSLNSTGPIPPPPPEPPRDRSYSYIPGPPTGDPSMEEDYVPPPPPGPPPPIGSNRSGSLGSIGSYGRRGSPMLDTLAEEKEEVDYDDYDTKNDRRLFGTATGAHLRNDTMTREEADLAKYISASQEKVSILDFLATSPPASPTAAGGDAAGGDENSKAAAGVNNENGVAGVGPNGTLPRPGATTADVDADVRKKVPRKSPTFVFHVNNVATTNLVAGTSNGPSASSSTTSLADSDASLSSSRGSKGTRAERARSQSQIVARASLDAGVATSGTAKAELAEAVIRERLGTQRGFFGYVEENLKDLHIVLASNVMGLEQWLNASTARGFRSGSTRATDKALERYVRATQISVSLVKHSHLVVEDVTSNSSQSQIGFSFIGFDAQHFDVGRVAVISAQRFFQHIGPQAFRQDDWHGSRNSGSIAKELMQSSPDVTELYEAGRVREAKRVAMESTMQILHNLCLAAFFRLQPRRLMAAETFSWEEVLSSVEAEQNQDVLMYWTAEKYLVNPTAESITHMLNLHSSNEETLMDEGLRIISDPIRWLMFLRVALRHRVVQLHVLITAIAQWKSEHDATNPRWHAFSLLRMQAFKEKEDLSQALLRIPMLRILTQVQITSQRRKSAVMLDGFLRNRDDMESMQKKNPTIFQNRVPSNPGTIGTLTREQLNGLEKNIKNNITMHASPSLKYLLNDKG